MSKHTPGPWHCESSLGLVRTTVDQSCICAMPHALNKRAIKMRKPGDDAEITPDQRLIAAAPDMLDVLETIENDDNSIPDWLWTLIKNVITKAKGGAA